MKKNTHVNVSSSRPFRCLIPLDTLSSKNGPDQTFCGQHVHDIRNVHGVGKAFFLDPDKFEYCSACWVLSAGARKEADDRSGI